MMLVPHTARQLGRAFIFAIAVSFSQLVGASCVADDTLRRSQTPQVFLGHAHECPPARDNSYQLCLPDQPVSRRAAEALSERLGKATDKAMLCAIDAVVIRSLIVCWEPNAPPPDPFNVLPSPDSEEVRNLESDLVLSDILTDLAEAWARQGDPERAATLFAGADELAALHQDHIPLVRDAVLKEWLAFEIGRGQLEEALHVVRALAAGHRHMLGQSPHWPATDLVDALKTEADLLSRLGRRDEAEDRRREAESLSAAPQ